MNISQTPMSQAAHDVAAVIPVVEIAHYAHQAGVGCPDGEMDPVGALVPHDMRAELVEQAKMRALRDQQVVDGAQHRPERVGIGDQPVAVAGGAAIADRLRIAEQLALEQEAVVHFAEHAEPAAVRLKASTVSAPGRMARA